MKVPYADYTEIAERARTETLTAIGDDYGVTRERIRQIVEKQGGESKHARSRRLRDERCLQHAEEVLYYREAWMPVHWPQLGLTYAYFVSWLNRNGVDHPDIKDRWIVARNNYSSHSGKVCIKGRVCLYCNVWKPWDEFYKSKNGANGHGHGCNICNREQVTHYTNLRYVSEPTVTEKPCPKCGETKPASHFTKSTSNTTGLQTYCKPCHASFPSQQPGYRP